MVKLKIYVLIGLVFIIAACHPANNADAKFSPGDRMDGQEFWRVIGYSAGAAGGDLRKEGKVLTEALTQYKPEQITEFEMELRRKILAANQYNLQAADKIIEGTITDGPFLFFRCWLIAQGQKTYDETLKNPDYLASVIEKGKSVHYEGLLYVSTIAYQKRTGKTTDDDSFPIRAALKNGLNYRFGGPKPTGTDWEESDLPKMCPDLWHLYRQ